MPSQHAPDRAPVYVRVPEALKAAAVARAAARGETLGDVVERALREYTADPEAPAQT